MLFGIDLDVREGEVVTLIGRNGMGKTTTIRSIMGMTPPTAAASRSTAASCAGSPRSTSPSSASAWCRKAAASSRASRCGENLTATAAARGTGKSRWTIDAILDLFPWISARRQQMGGQLSGGEQQMLAIARALMTNPQLLILDEATEGSPIIRQDIRRVLRRLKDGGQSILIVDKNVKVLARLADRHYVLERGRVRWSGDSRALASDYDTCDVFVGTIIMLSFRMRAPARRPGIHIR